MRVKLDILKYLNGDYNIAFVQGNKEHDLGEFAPDEIKLLIEDLKEIIDLLWWKT